MSAGHTIILGSERAAKEALRVIIAAPVGSVLSVKPPRRSTAQNDLMWTLLGEVSRAKPEGRNLPPDIWKCIFLAACGHQVRFEPTLEGDGVIPIGFRSSRLTKDEMSDVIECILEYGARHGVEFDQQEAA